MSLRIATVDLNGQFRGKRVPDAAVGKRANMPLSVLNLDIEGADIDGSPLVFATGDQDGVLVPYCDPVPLPWLGAARLQPAMTTTDGTTPFAGDPRQALVAVLDHYAARGQQVIAACELEFYLLEADAAFAPALNPVTGRRLAETSILSLREMDGFDAFFTDVEHGAQAMGLADLTITGEAGIGQFEVTLAHGPALKAADDVVLLKELIKGTARTHGMAATFMAKPFPTESGNGLHTHFSVLNGDRNVLTDAATLGAAVAGCLDHFTQSTLIFAPFGNSFARFVDAAHAPTSATWGYDNRTVALRIPAGPPAATRIEHRVAGGDVNPYLLFATIFGAALDGMTRGAKPADPTDGNAYAQSGADRLYPSLDTAITGFQAASWDGIFPPLLVENLAMTKRQEHTRFQTYSDTDTLWKLGESV
ncbi:MAG: glutamine synthetase family protein [Pseudomonadota bacterium]